MELWIPNAEVNGKGSNKTPEPKGAQKENGEVVVCRLPVVLFRDYLMFIVFDLLFSFSLSV